MYPVTAAENSPCLHICIVESFRFVLIAPMIPIARNHKKSGIRV